MQSFFAAWQEHDACVLDTSFFTICAAERGIWTGDIWIVVSGHRCCFMAAIGKQWNLIAIYGNVSAKLAVPDEKDARQRR